MNKQPLLEYMKENILFLDGGMGTLLQEAGLAPGESPEWWSVTHPEDVYAIHKSYFDAGSNLVLINTFGVNGLKYTDSEIERIVGGAVACAKRALRESPSDAPKWVALDVGPLGKMLAPYGEVDFESAVSAFSSVIAAGSRHGVDCIVIETMSDTLEAKAATLAAKEGCDLPVFVSCAYGADGKLLTGGTPDAVISMLEGLGVDALGINCSLGPKQIKPIVNEYLHLSSLPVFVKPNAGMPAVIDGSTVYDVGADEFARLVGGMAELGVSAVGGCCGTTPEYIKKLTDISVGLKPVPVQDKGISLVSSYTHSVRLGEGFPVLIGERINPTGKRRIKEALRSSDIGYILSEGLGQADRGAQILDVNAGLPDIDEAEMLTRIVTELQAVCDLPLQIDTADPSAMKAALRVYNGKPMLNSVNGKAEVMREVFPIAKKYGALTVALTLDERGIPEKAEERLEIARNILSVAKSYGINKKDIVFDPLTLAVSADPRAAAETLRAVELIRRELDCHVSLGVSNVSFGLPARDILNGSFFTLAMARGLCAAIMNPYSGEMMRAYHAYRALMGKDEGFAQYIPFAEGEADSISTPSKEKKSTRIPTLEGKTELECAIIRGFKKSAAELCAAALESTAPLEVVEKEIIPALDYVGRGYEEGRVYLPGLLMSAEAASAAFEVIKSSVKRAAATKCTVVLATVRGDVHDIGKNIVKLLLENYGFEVVDLGRDVPPERIVHEAKRHRAALVGLSALMTTTLPAMAETVKLLSRELPECRVMVGGAVLTDEYAEKIGADFYGKDAMEAVRYAENVNNDVKNNNMEGEK